ncbi:MAG TPA: formate C-acetyltransferase [Bacillota bacterium]|nr:formate C-acetyltransferase [Bacillota bacterium]HPE38351.1 formate C-acetyltransferase [Bacillota bacterium]
MFIPGKWNEDIHVRDFINRNYTPYDGDESFLAPPTEATKALWQDVLNLRKQESEAGGVLDIDDKTISTIISHKPGYIDQDKEQIVGLQTDAPLKRAIMPFGGIRMVRTSLEAYDHKLDPEVEHVFQYRKTHNEGVFDAYTPEMQRVRHAGLITGLPDAYGRGRIIGDYRRLPLYGTAFLIACKRKAKDSFIPEVLDAEAIQSREEISEQVKALNELTKMAASYGFDISRAARNFREAVQWLYFGYLGSVKEQNGAAMSLGRTSTFLDIYAEEDLKAGTITESEVQEIVDHFIMKLRMVRFLRTPAYDELFSGDPTWITESIGGIGVDGRHMVTKMSYRFLHTLTNLGPAPEPNLTILWSPKLPVNFKKYCTKVSIETSSIQYENDDLMREKFGDDYAIACCVSAMRVGKQMQFFGARANLAKALLYSINGGKDEKSGDQVGPVREPITSEYLNYDEVMARYDETLQWLSKLYINTLNVIHYMHDKYCYERLEMALHDEKIVRTMACGIAGLSVVADSLSAIKYAKVRPIRNEQGLAVDFEIEGEFPQYGNDNPKVDKIAAEIVRKFMKELSKHRCYRGAKPTQSILTITSNVVYGKKTGSTPDGRKLGEPLAPGANPMHGRDHNGAIASMRSVANLQYDYSEDGISYTFSILPATLGKEKEEQETNLTTLLDGYFTDGGHHINVNVIQRKILLDAMSHPENYPQLTIRVSGYAVHFVQLTHEQQLEVVRRTVHAKL